MSLNSILNIANSGLTTAQAQLRVVSDNVANVNTVGYVRKIADQTSLASQGVGSGVDIGRIRLATDRFLQAASYNANGEASRQSVRYELYDQIQSLFGDPGGDDGFFTQIDSVFSSFAATAEKSTSSPLRQDALFKTQALFDEATRISTQIQSVRANADGRIKTAVDTANGLLQQIEALNVDISRAAATSGDATGSINNQATLIGQLSALMDVKVAQRDNGGVTIRTGSGIMLAGAGAAKLDYQATGSASAESKFADIYVTEPGGQKRSLTEGLVTGEIKGLLELRDVEAPAAAERLGELMSHVADELNRAHNANSSVPAPTTLTGKNVGQSLETALTGFTGTTTIAVTNPTTGAIVTSAQIVFSGSTMTVNGAAADPTTFLTTLNTQLGGAATASFTDGKLTVSAAGANGVAIADDATSPSAKAGRGFSHYFGLNDLVTTDRTATYDIGLTASSQHGFAAGQTIALRFSGPDGARIRDVTIAVPAGAGTMSELLTAMNNPITGAGRYGSFALDAGGAVVFKGNADPAASVSVIEDNTTQAPSGVSMTQLFGVGGGARASRADGFTVRADITANPAKLALAKLNLSAAAGTAALSAGDGRGALGLADAGQRSANFQAAGGSAGGAQSVSRYASDLSGDIGARASAAKTRSGGATAIQTEVNGRQNAYEGVNLDEELVNMTTFQQSFNSSARLIQAVKDMYDTLLGMI